MLPRVSLTVFEAAIEELVPMVVVVAMPARSWSLGEEVDLVSEGLVTGS